MCQHLMIVAEHGARQYVGQCEHGTVHVAWGLAMLNMRPDDFTQLATLLATCLDCNDFTAMRGGSFRMFCTAHGTFQLWIGTIGLYLTPTDLTIFVQLLDDARQILQHATAHPYHTPGLGNDFQVMYVRDNGSFVPN